MIQGFAMLLGLGLCAGSPDASADEAAHRHGQQIQRKAEVEAQKTIVIRTENKARKDLLVAGTGLLGAFWAASAITGEIIQMETPTAPKRLLHVETQLAAPQGVQLAGPHRREEASGGHRLLLIPVAGPWVALGAMRPSTSGAVGLAALGVGQTVGLAMLVGGIAMPNEVRVRVHKQHTIRMSAAPTVSSEGLGLTIRGSM